jgi:uncharacterized protein YbbC (DUF1343 family)
MRYNFLLTILIGIILTSCFPQRRMQSFKPASETIVASPPSPARELRIRPGAERTRQYFHDLKGDKRVAVVVNQTSIVGSTHLVDTLLSESIQITKIFSPEHGIRGSADAGMLIDNEIDIKTGIPIISLYGNHKKPTPEDMVDIDIVVFDLQDVGARFYTYISTLTYVMEACAEHNVPLLILDRPNPNGFYVDGPVLDPKYKSFIGMHPIPVVHGMTIAEYGRMVNGEGWLSDSLQCKLDWVECSGYSHKSRYSLPVKPSPNLPDMNSVILYPSLCFFEGTRVSVGRGTDYPFTVIGHPSFPYGTYKFTPESKLGALNPPYKGVECSGFYLADSAESIVNNPGIRLHWLIDMYKSDTAQGSFFTSFFTKLAGNEILQKQISEGMDENTIRLSWQPGIEAFLKKREKYLLYRDF